VEDFMIPVNIILSLTNILSAIILIVIILHAYKHRDINGALQYAFLVFAMLIHTVGYAFELIGSSPDSILFWGKIEYIGISFYPVLLMVFSRRYGDDRSLIVGIVSKLLVVINFITFILVISFPASHLYYAEIGYQYVAGYITIEIKEGVWYFVQVSAMSIAIIYSIYVNIKKIINSKGIYRKRAGLMLAGILIPIMGAAIYITNMSPNNYDLSTLSYMLMGVLVMFSLFKFNMLNLVPVTYKKVFESIDEAVLVLDENLSIININEAVGNMFKIRDEIKIGEPVSDFCRSLDIECDFEKKEQVLIDKFTNQMHNLKITKIYNKYKKVLGYIWVFTDVTEAHLYKRKLETLVNTDDLTGISNRRHVLSQYNLEIEVPNSAIFMAFMDLDYFKHVNDTYGHQIGDQVLIELSGLIKDYFKLPNYVGRYGGEEFIAVIHCDNEKTSYEYLDAFRLLVENHKFAHHVSTITLSIGFVKSSGHIDDDIRLADKALYIAKKNGRNQVVSYHNHTLISA